MYSLNDPELVRKAYADEKRYAARMATHESPAPARGRSSDRSVASDVPVVEGGHSRRGKRTGAEHLLERHG